MTIAHYFTMEKCVNVQKSPTEKCDVCVNIHMKNVIVYRCNFRANKILDMCKKVICVLPINTYIYIMCIAICIIYVHDDVYEHVNVCIDGYITVVIYR